MSDSSHFFIFGRTPALSFLELKTFFPEASHIIPGVGSVVESILPAEVSPLVDMLGGTVKIAEKVAEVDVLDAAIAAFLPKQPSVTFGISLYGEGVLPKALLSDIKKALESQGTSARYVTPHDGETLSSVTLDKRHVAELIVFRAEKQFIVARTVAIQDYDAWSRRDYGRPRADAKSGMLPMKVARMLVNIATGSEFGAKEERQKTIYDPFCGMGTIVAEGFIRGCRMFGSDVSADVIVKAKENITWLTKNYPNDRGAVVKLFTADAVHVSEVMPAGSVHAIVTEPFMGPTEIALHTRVDMEKARNQLKGLEKLYIGCLRHWRPILAEKGKVIIALPSYAVNGRELSVKKVVDMCEILGYTIVDGPIEYSRPHAVVKRQFYIFQKK